MFRVQGFRFSLAFGPLRGGVRDQKGTCKDTQGYIGTPLLFILGLVGLKNQGLGFTVLRFGD